MYGALFGQRLVNYRSRPVLITHIDPVSDPGIIATYLGHSDCLSGCPGAMALEGPSAQEMLRTSIDGLYPIELEPESLLRTLVFKVEVDGASGASELVAKCGLYVRSMVLTLDDGSKVEVKHGSADYVVGVDLSPSGLPEATSHCNSEDEADHFAP